MCFYLCWSILNSCNWLVASGISKILMSSKVMMLKYEIFSPHYPFQCSWWMVNLFWSIRIITCFPVFFFVIWYVLRSVYFNEVMKMYTVLNWHTFCLQSLISPCIVACFTYDLSVKNFIVMLLPFIYLSVIENFKVSRIYPYLF